MDPSRHNFEHYLTPRFVSQSYLAQPLAAGPAIGALRDKVEGVNFQNKCFMIQ